ncbi:MAG: magnesium chelatase [Acidobacteria bacterium]|nr:MAG: magnesium chelatase [Acidobacteriota bacterium]
MIALNHLLEVIKQIKQEVGKVIIGQERVLDQTLIAIFTNQHALIEGVPGTGKTLLVRTLGKVLGCDSSRIQFTPDLMPADITGTHVYNMQKNQFDLVKGPVFTTFLLADEINRAPAKTQSALLQSMQERQVTIDRETIKLSSNFTVFATQNPIEFEGTYALPEAQRDRFMMKIQMELPNREEELTLAKRMIQKVDSPEAVLESNQVQPVIVEDDLMTLRMALEGIKVKEDILDYLVETVRKTRRHEGVLVGAGPRAVQALLLGTRALAAIRNRDFITPDDVKELTPAVLSHRIILRPEFEIEGLTVSEVIESIQKEIMVPR